MRLSISVLVLVCSAVTSCGVVPEKVSIDDPRVTPMLEAVAKVDRQRRAFHRSAATPSFASSSARAMAMTSCFEGPRKYKTVDGEFLESITLTYDKVAASVGS